MSEEKNDNLPQADGNVTTNSTEMVPTETAVLEQIETVETSNSEMAEAIEEIDSSVTDGELQTTVIDTPVIENQVIQDTETLVVAAISPQPEEAIVVEAELDIHDIVIDTPQSENQILQDTEISVTEAIATLTEEAVAPISEVELSDNASIIDAIADINAEESEDETLKERHDIPMLDYDALSLESLVDELKNLVTNEKVMSVKDHVEEIKKAFLAKYYHLLDEKKEEFLAENQDPNEEFKYHFPLKSKFDQYYSQFRDSKNSHFKSLQSNLKTNLENRLAIVEALKELINPQASIKDTLKHFNDLRERWKNAGPIPKDKYNHVWNNYHFHVENFYDYLHLDRDCLLYTSDAADE